MSEIHDCVIIASNGTLEKLGNSFPCGDTWVNFCWVCAAGLSEPLPRYRSILGHIIDPILVTFGQIRNFRDPNLVTLYFMNWPIFLDWMKNALLFTRVQYKHSGMFANRENEELSYLKNQKMCDPILVRLYWKFDPIIVNPVVKMRPHPTAHPH